MPATTALKRSQSIPFQGTLPRNIGDFAQNTLSLGPVYGRDSFQYELYLITVIKDSAIARLARSAPSNISNLVSGYLFTDSLSENGEVQLNPFEEDREVPLVLMLMARTEDWQ